MTFLSFSVFSVNPEENVLGLSKIKTNYTLTYVIKCKPASELTVPTLLSLALM